MGEMAEFQMDQHWGYDEPLYDFGGTKTCRCCGQDGLLWTQREEDGKWVLAELIPSHGGYKWVIHECPVNPLQDEQNNEKVSR